jgi:UDP-4-amino-4-deoxy-L-arabinose formyltransferase/UDP-glucuronic acid dehydrogenase (UDP-4-keto-hexauronic acid decarboxylating)
MKTVVLAYHNMGIAGLDALEKHGYEIAAIFTHEDDPGENCWFGSVKEWAKSHGVTFYTTEQINSPQWVEKIKALEPDILFSFYYRKMLGQAILDVPRIGALNLHGSLLPAYRGRCPVNWVIIKGEKKTGVSLHFMVEKPDAGDLVAQREVLIDPDDTAQMLYEKLCLAAGQLLDDILPLIKKEEIPRTEQDLSRGSYYGGRRPEDGRINWQQDAKDIYNLIRAVTDPYPGAFAFLEDGLQVKILKATMAEGASGKEPGDILISGRDVLVQTGNGAIRLGEIELQENRIADKSIRDIFCDRKVAKLQ